MKLFIIAALIAVTAAGRLEHLERSYLPPASNSGFGSPQASFGTGNQGSFGGSNGFGVAGAGQPNYNTGGPSSGVSNQYLPPNRGASSNDASRFGGSGFAGQNGLQGSSSPSQRYSIPSTSYGTPQEASVFGSPSRSQSQFGAASRQYLAPHANSGLNGQSGAGASQQYVAPHAGSSQIGGQQQFSVSQNGGSHFSAASRQYLAPHTGTSYNDGQRQFGASRNGGSQFGAASRQYLAPHADSQNGGQRQFGGSQFGAPSRQYGAPQAGSSLNRGSQFGTPSRQYGAPQAGSSLNSGSQFGARYQNSGAASRQYLAPNVGSSQPQQPFNELTGYQY